MISTDKIPTIEGNLLDFPCEITRIAHSCNTHNVMGAGIAKQIKDRYPNAYESDCHARYEDQNNLGNWSFAWTDSTCQRGIYNLYTQSQIGGKRAVNYEAFHKSLSFVAEHLHYNYLHGEDDVILGLPYGISCGLAGGNWNIIYEMINDILADMPYQTFIVKYD